MASKDLLEIKLTTLKGHNFEPEILFNKKFPDFKNFTNIKTTLLLIINALKSKIGELFTK